MKRLSLEQFIEKANIIHNSQYEYSMTIFNAAREKVAINCKIHGIFWQLPANHLFGMGCHTCGKEKSVANRRKNYNKILDDFNQVHNFKYDYSRILYINNYTKITIRCINCDRWFDQLPKNHINGDGCIKCGATTSISENSWLDHLNIPISNRQVVLTINKRKYIVDGVDPNTKTVYEFYGDFWHGNPKMFDLNSINTKTGKTFRELYNKIINRESIIKTAGFDIISIWESDWH